MNLSKGTILNVAQVAELLNRSEDWVRALARTGDLPSFKLGRYRSFYKEDVENWLDDKRRTAAVERSAGSRLQVVSNDATRR